MEEEQDHLPCLNQERLFLESGFIKKQYLLVGEGLGTKQGPSWSMAVPVCPPERGTQYHTGPSRGRREAWWARHIHF